jgi:hypothetical protein
MALCYSLLMKYRAQLRKISVLLLLAIGLMTNGTWAQGTGQAFPDPIDSRTLEIWMEEAPSKKASDSISTIWGPCLDRYQAQYRMIRDGEVEAWIVKDSVQDKNDPEGVEKLARSRRSILEKIRDLDELLASEITLALQEDDSFRMRLSNRLARRRTLSICRRLGRSKIAMDLVDQVGALEPSQEVMKELTPLLTAWDAETRRELEIVTKSMLDLSVEKARLGLGTFQDSMASQEPGAAWSDWHEAREELLDDQYKALARITRRTVEVARSMQSILTRKKHDALMDRILPKLYGPYLSGKSDLPAIFEKAMNRLDALEDEKDVQLLEELENGWRMERKETTDELLDVVSSRRGNRFMMPTSEEEQMESSRRMTRIRQLRTDRKELDERFREMLYAMMGESLPATETPEGAALPMNTLLEGLPEGFDISMDMIETDGMPESGFIIGITGTTLQSTGEADALVAGLMQNGLNGDGSSGVLVLSTSVPNEGDIAGALGELTGALQSVEIASGDMIGAAEMSPIDFNPYGSFPFRPRTISNKRLLEFAEAQNLSESQTMIMTLLHEDYVTLYEIQSELWSRDQFGSFDDDMRDMMERQLEVVIENEKVRRTLQEIDLNFLADLETTLSGVVSEESIRRFIERRQRDFHRECLTGRGGMQPWIPTSGEPMAELETLVEEFGLENDGDVSELIRKWHLEITPLFVKCHDSKMTLKRVETTVMLQQMNELGTDSDMKDLKSALERSVRVNQQLADLNSTTARRIADMQRGSKSSEFLHAWRKMTWPSIYEDGSADQTRLALEIAGVMDELEAIQIAEIMTLAMTFEAKYETMSIDMIEARKSLESGSIEDEQNMITAMRDYEKIKFERDELNARTARRLEEVVGAELASQLKGHASSLERSAIPAPSR